MLCCWVQECKYVISICGKPTDFLDYSEEVIPYSNTSQFDCVSLWRESLLEREQRYRVIIYDYKNCIETRETNDARMG